MPVLSLSEQTTVAFKRRMERAGVSVQEQPPISVGRPPSRVVSLPLRKENLNPLALIPEALLTSGLMICPPSAVHGQFRRAVSSVVERLVYTELVGGSNPSLPTIFLQGGSL